MPAEIAERALSHQIDNLEPTLIPLGDDERLVVGQLNAGLWKTRPDTFSGQISVISYGNRNPLIGKRQANLLKVLISGYGSFRMDCDPSSMPAPMARLRRKQSSTRTVRTNFASN
jgi:hypothetical protein